MPLKQKERRSEDVCRAWATRRDTCLGVSSCCFAAAASARGRWPGWRGDRRWRRALPRRRSQPGRPPPVPTANSAYTGEVEIWGWLGADNHFIAARDAGRYAAMFPDLTVTPVRFSCPDAHANLLNALTSGLNVPDLVNFHASYTNSFADGLLDLGERFAPYSQHFPPRILNLAISADRVVGVPQDIEPVALAYRADIFERYGITEDDLATWEGYVEAGRKLWRDSGETIKMIAMDAPGSQMAVFGAPHQVHEVFLHLAGYHGVFFDREDRAVIIDERQALIAFETFQTITAPEVAWIFQNPTVSVEAYRAGRVATNICPAWWIVVLSTEFSDQAGLWRLMPLPALRPGFPRAALQIPTLTGIPLMALNPDAAWEVLYDTQITADAAVSPLADDRGNHAGPP